MDFTDHELALCVAALDNAANNLQEGCAAAARLNMPMPENIKNTAVEMVALKEKIMGQPHTNGK